MTFTGANNPILMGLFGMPIRMNLPSAIGDKAGRTGLVGRLTAGLISLFLSLPTFDKLH